MVAGEDQRRAGFQALADGLQDLLLGVIAGQVMQHPNQGGGVIGLAGGQAVQGAQVHLGAVQQLVLAQLRHGGFEHGCRRVDGGELPPRFQRRCAENFLGGAAHAHHQDSRLTPAAQAGGQQAGGQFMAGFVAGQGDAALLGVFVGSGGVELFCAGGGAG